MPEGKKTNRIEKDNGASPAEKLNEYIRIGSVGGKVLIAALVIVFIILLVWGLTGRIAFTFTEKCLVAWDLDYIQNAYCFVGIDKNISNIKENDPVSIRMPDGRELSAKVLYIGDVPVAESDIRNAFPDLSQNIAAAYYDWVLDNMLEGKEYVYTLSLMIEDDVSDYNMTIGEATVEVGEVRPISFLTRQ